MRTSASSASTRVLISAFESSVWIENISATWSPMVRSGLSAVIGSWKIMAMPAPRTPRISLTDAAQRSRPSNMILPRSILTSFGNSRMMAFAIIDLPEPDLPTTHRISLGTIESDTSDRACARSAPRGSRTLRFSSERTGSLIGSSASG